MITREIKYLRPDQIRQELNTLPLAYLPVGPLEWHGPHLPIGTDPLNAEKAAQLAAEATGGLIFPALYWGTERERSEEVLDWLGFEPGSYVVGMDFPANSLPSMYASEEVFGLVVREQLRLMVRMGFKWIVIISGHGAENQIAVLNRLAAEFSAETPARVLVALPFVIGEDGVMRVGHASQIETALMLALYPDTVQLDRLPPLPEPLKNLDWAVVDYSTFMGAPMPDHTVHPEDDPRRATPEEGQNTVERAARQIADKVKQSL
jgi:creatinine amidohydrolase